MQPKRPADRRHDSGSQVCYRYRRVALLPHPNERTPHRVREGNSPEQCAPPSPFLFAGATDLRVKGGAHVRQTTRHVPRRRTRVDRRRTKPRHPHSRHPRPPGPTDTHPHRAQTSIAGTAQTPGNASCAGTSGASTTPRPTWDRRCHWEATPPAHPKQETPTNRGPPNNAPLPHPSPSVSERLGPRRGGVAEWALTYPATAALSRPLGPVPIADRGRRQRECAFAQLLPDCLIVDALL